MAKVYIELEAAIEALVGLTIYDNAPALNAAVEKEYHNGREWIGGVRDALIEIGDLPAADVAPVRHGTWIKADEQPYFRKHYHAQVCSECGKRKDGKWLYCPYCGSKNQDGGHDNG